MPKDRQKINRQQAEAAVVELARQLGESAPSKSTLGFANAVYISERYVYKLVPLDATGLPEHPKEREVLEFLAGHLPSRAKQHVPRLVLSTPLIEGLGTVAAYSRLPGHTIDHLPPSLALELGNFLHDLHDCASHQVIHEFEEETRGQGFTDYVIRSVEKFRDKLQAAVTDPSLLALAERAAARATEMVTTVAEPELVTLHKDLHGDNILAQDGKLTGIIDWEAAQAGPREWEFAILRQRFPSGWRVVRDSYGIQLDDLMLDLCGLMQGLRFWKSFPHQDSFVKQQVDYICAILRE